MEGDRDASGQNSLMITRLGYRMRSLLGCFCGQRIVFWNESSGKEMLVRIVAMLSKLVVRFDPEQYRVGESASA